MGFYNDRIIEFFNKKEYNEYKYKYTPCKLDTAPTISVLGFFFALVNAFETILMELEEFASGEKDIKQKLDWVTILTACELSTTKDEENNVFIVGIDFSNFDENNDLSLLYSTLPSLEDIFTDDYINDLAAELAEIQNISLNVKANTLIGEYHHTVMQCNLICYCLKTYNQIINYDMEGALFAVKPLSKMDLIDNYDKPIFLIYFMGLAHFFRGDASDGLKYLEYFTSDMELNEKRMWISVSFMLLFNFNRGIARNKIDIFLLDKKLPDAYKYLMLKVLEIAMMEEGDLKSAKLYNKKAEKLVYRDFQTALYQLDQYCSEDETELAKSLLQRLERLKPDDYDLLCLKADNLIDELKFGEALTVCSKISGIKPYNYLNYYRKALCHKGLNNISRARDFFEMSIDLEHWLPIEEIVIFRKELDALENENKADEYQQSVIDFESL